MDAIEPRFQDQNLRLADFAKEVWVACPSCAQKAIATVDFEAGKARLLCAGCGYNKEASTTTQVLGQTGAWQIAAHHYFEATLWLQHPFKNETFWAYNPYHLEYLRQYIGATLRESKDRSHFTLLEKLPKFYHEAKNREALLKIIEKLKKRATP